MKKNDDYFTNEIKRFLATVSKLCDYTNPTEAQLVEIEEELYEEACEFEKIPKYSGIEIVAYYLYFDNNDTKEYVEMIGQMKVYFYSKHNFVKFFKDDTVFSDVRKFKIFDFLKQYKTEKILSGAPAKSLQYENFKLFLQLIVNGLFHFIENTEQIAIDKKALSFLKRYTEWIELTFDIDINHQRQIDVFKDTMNELTTDHAKRKWRGIKYAAFTTLMICLILLSSMNNGIGIFSNAAILLGVAIPFLYIAINSIIIYVAEYYLKNMIREVNKQDENFHEMQRIKRMNKFKGESD